MPTLFSLAEEMRRCTACPLWKGRTLAVAGSGPKDAKIMFIGEAPGEQEDRTGQPFVGRSGKVLDEMLKVANLSREEVFITGSCKCRPSNNRNPTATELATCKDKWLLPQIEIIKPKMIVLLGRVALYNLLKEKNVNELRGQIIKHAGQQYFVTFHPAAAMRFPKIREMMQDDFGRLKHFYMEL